MDFTPIAPTDLKNNIDDLLVERADQLLIDSAKLTGSHADKIIDSIKEQLRITNSYYSNRIESEGTHPLSIEAAMQRKFSDDTKERHLQQLSIAHIETQKWLEKQISEKRVASPYGVEFITDIHRHLYSREGMESFLHIKHDGLEAHMMPGELRHRDVVVARHVAPEANSVNSLMRMYEDLYTKSLKRPMGVRLVYALASHHRLVWIHPFLDGNGRTARLGLDAAFLSMGVEGYGLWNISRGLARNIQGYKETLHRADIVRQGSMDGRGSLSSRTLEEFVRFMLDCAEDQIAYMGQYLKLDTLAGRFDAYVEKSINGIFDIDPLPKNSNNIFKELLLYGEIPRGRVPALIGAKERKSSGVIKELLARGYLVSDTAKGAIRLKIGSRLANYLFPELVPDK